MEHMTLIRELLPCFVTAGNYLCRVQADVKSRAPKEAEGSVFSQALTDADISVQGFFEVVMLALYPEVVFDSEEAEHSVNLKYFPPDASQTVILDPINGTKPFKDGLPCFEIIMTMAEAGELVWVILYSPMSEFAFFAIRGVGTFRMSKQEINEGADPCRFSLFEQECGSNVVRANKVPEEMVVRLDTVFDVWNKKKAYDPAKQNYAMSDVLLGNICASMDVGGKIEDRGAIAFIVEWAGGVVSDFSGQSIDIQFDPKNRRIPELLVSRDRKTHDRVIGAISG